MQIAAVAHVRSGRRGPIRRKSSKSQSNASDSHAYRSNADPPSAVRSHLPTHAQDIYREAFNHAFASHAGDVRQEELARRTASAAVKRS
jgi:cation transport regulator